MVSVILGLATVSVLGVAWYSWRRSRSNADAVHGYLLRYTDVTGWQAIPAVAHPHGIVADDVTYPALPSLRISGVVVWLMLVDYPALVQHEALERARESAALSSLWQGGGQWLDWMRVVGVIVPAILSVVVWRQVDAIAAQIAQVLVLLGEIK